MKAWLLFFPCFIVFSALGPMTTPSWGSWCPGVRWTCWTSEPASKELTERLCTTRSRLLLTQTQKLFRKAFQRAACFFHDSILQMCRCHLFTVSLRHSMHEWLFYRCIVAMLNATIAFHRFSYNLLWLFVFIQSLGWCYNLWATRVTSNMSHGCPTFKGITFPWPYWLTRHGVLALWNVPEPRLMSKPPH